MKTSSLPVDSHLPVIIESLKVSTLVLLEAAPGAGKTTRVPVALLRAGYKRVYILEPRRLAARMAAKRVSEELGESLGETAGYKVRFEEVGTCRTSIWYLTEGVLTRKLLSGSELLEVEVVILDEFHERHLETDLALSLLLHLQKRRPELKLLLMSATLGADDIRVKLGNPPFLDVPGRMFPVDVTYTPHSPAALEDQVSMAVARILKQTQGGVLVFLPGAPEIRNAMKACEGLSRASGATLHALYGDLPSEEQDRAVQPGKQRKIIFSTNVAESSITIEGIEAVVDSGLARVMTYSAWNGFARLRVEKVSQASSIQRTGRAGRMGPGVAVRLFPESDFIRRPAGIQPEIVRADFAATLLQLAANAIPWQQLQWLDAPPAENVQQATELLSLLGALDREGQITSIGRQMARIPLHPRLARFLVAAGDAGVAREAVDLAAQLSDGRFRPNERRHATFASDLDAMLAADANHSTKLLRQQLGDTVRNARLQSVDPHALEKALLFAYPDRVARKRGETLLFANGASAKLSRTSHASGDFILALEIETDLVRIAVDVEPDWLLDAFPDQVCAVDELAWNREAERVEQRHALRYQQLLLDESSSTAKGSSVATQMLIEKVMEAGVERFADADALEAFMRRLRFAAEHAGFDLPADLLQRGLRDLASGLTSFAELRTAARENALLTLLEAHVPMRLVEQVAPLHVNLPSGRRARVEYHDGRPPSVASRLQDFFGLKSSPTIVRGAVPLVVQLLAPNQRPVQVTTDLASFWKNLYPQVRRELSRRYPRHSWPEDPT